MIIVIGAGIGGLSLAARLAKSGFLVKIIEKNAKPGGRCNYLKKDGHLLDTGPTVFMMKEVYTKTFADMGEKMDDYIDLIRVDPSYQIYFRDGSKLIMTTNQKKMKVQMEAFEQGSYNALQQYLKEGETNYNIAMPNLIDREFKHFYNFINPKTLYLLFKLRILKKHYGYTKKFFKDSRLREAFTFQDTYLGLNPYNAPSIFSMIPYLELNQGVWLPKGGMYSIVTALTQICKNTGVDFFFDSPVKQINTSKNHVTGVTLANGRQLSGDIIVANADLVYVYNSLLPKDKMTKRLNNKKFTCSTLTFLWGVDKRFPQLSVHNLFMSGDYKTSCKEVIDDLKLPKDPSFYLHIPTRLNEFKVPNNHDSIAVIVPVGHINEKNPQNWKILQKDARKVVIERLNEVCETDFEKHLKFEVSYTPEDWQNYLNLPKGSTLGLAHNLSQLCYFRPKNKHKKYRNLYFVGASTHPGSGVTSALISARLAFDRIIRETTSNAIN